MEPKLRIELRLKILGDFSIKISSILLSWSIKVWFASFVIFERHCPILTCSSHLLFRWIFWMWDLWLNWCLVNDFKLLHYWVGCFDQLNWERILFKLVEWQILRKSFWYSYHYYVFWYMPPFMDCHLLTLLFVDEAFYMNHIVCKLTWIFLHDPHSKCTKTIRVFSHESSTNLVIVT